MLHVILIDDEPDARRNLRQLLDRYCPGVQIAGEADGVRSGAALIREQRPEVVLLDIQMQDGTGFDLLARFPDADFGVIFTTAFDQFALKAFACNAIDYLVKPIDPEELRRAIRKVQANKNGSRYGEQLAGLIEAMQGRKLDKLSLSTSEGLIFLRLQELVRLEAEGSYTHFHLLNGRHVMVARGLREFEELLPGDSFFRIHKSHLINLHRVQGVLREDGGYTLMEGGAKLPVARRKKEAFLVELGRISLG